MRSTICHCINEFLGGGNARVHLNREAEGKELGLRLYQYEQPLVLRLFGVVKEG